MANLSDSLTFRHGATVANRFVQPPMLTYSGKDGYATKNGGPALTWKRGREQLAAYDDKFIPQLKKVAQAIKHDGNKAIMQIAHTGREANFRAMEGKKFALQLVLKMA